MHQRRARDSSAGLQQKPQIAKETHGWVKTPAQLRSTNLKSFKGSGYPLGLSNGAVLFFVESSDRDYLPHQEARMNAGLEKALQHKDKLLEYDKNRYYGIHSAIIVIIDVEMFASVIAKIVGVIESEEWLGYNAF